MDGVGGEGITGVEGVGINGVEGVGITGVEGVVASFTEFGILLIAGGVIFSFAT